MPFWKEKTLSEMTHEEWESLCDGCAQCCLLRLEDEDTKEMACTSITCNLLDHNTLRCTQYSKRFDLVKDCLKIDSDAIFDLKWLPVTCAYKRVAQNKALPEWHPLISGDLSTAHKAVPLKDFNLKKLNDVNEENWHEYIISIDE